MANPSGRTMPARIWKKFTISDGCWEWHGSIRPNGYGQVRDEGRVAKAHRVVYEYLKGPIPDGLVIDHLCRNRRCVRPSHMETVTQWENLRRGDGRVYPEDGATCRSCGNAMYKSPHSLSRRGWRWRCRPCHAAGQRRRWKEKRGG